MNQTKKVKRQIVKATTFSTIYANGAHFSVNSSANEARILFIDKKPIPTGGEIDEIMVELVFPLPMIKVILLSIP